MDTIVDLTCSPSIAKTVLTLFSTRVKMSPYWNSFIELAHVLDATPQMSATPSTEPCGEQNMILTFKVKLKVTVQMNFNHSILQTIGPGVLILTCSPTK